MRNADYESMLKMDRPEFEKLLTYRIYNDRQNLLNEMTAHEDKTWSFAKSMRPDAPKKQYAELMYSVFDMEKQTGAVDTLDKLTQATQPYMSKDDKSVQAGLVEQTLMAKAATEGITPTFEEGGDPT